MLFRSVDEIEKALETPDKTFLLIEDAVEKSTPYQGSLSNKNDDVASFGNSIDINSFKEGDKKVEYNYNNLIGITDTEIKNAAQFLKDNANRITEAEAKIREVAGAMEFFSGRKLKNINIEFRKTTAREAASFLALARKGGTISSLSHYNPKTDTITIQPQTFIGLLDNSPAALSSVHHIANELTHALQFQTNNGNLIGLLNIELSDFDTAKNVQWMKQGVYAKGGKYFKDINIESNWGSDLSIKFFQAKNNIQQVSVNSFVEDNPKVKEALQEKETQDFISNIVQYGIEAKAGITPAIEARAGETPSRLYAETFELFNRYTEPQGMQTIKVEARNVEEAKNLIRRTEDYKRIKSRYPKVFSMGDPIPARRPGESPFQIEAKAGVTPQMDAEYSQAINGDTGNDTITPKTNQEAWAKNNPESASKIESLIFQRLYDVGHLWRGTWKPAMFKAAFKDFDSANGEIGSFFTETKEHAMDYMERGHKIFSAYIKMENPATSSDVIRVLSKAFPQYAEQFRSDEGDWGAVMSTGTIREGIQFVKAMQDAGYDGVAQWDGSDSVAVVFNPNQEIGRAHV